MTLTAGTKLGPYEILSPLGAGGMGEVYRAKDTRLDRDVAIKVLPSHLTDNAEFKQRFEREAKSISNLSHPNICTLHDIGHEDGIDYLVMEYLEGETLAERLAKGTLPLEQVLHVGVEIAAALDNAHRADVVHRDLKPGNIMLTKSGAKLLDFGLAKRGTTSSLASSPVAATITEPLTGKGTIVGTFQYMAPEQLEGKEADTRTDIFAFGATLYETATGTRAFEGSSRASLIASIMASQPRPISELQPMTPPALDRLIRKCLAKDPDARWQTAADLADELRWIAEGGFQDRGVAGTRIHSRTRERFWMAAAALLFVAAAAMTIHGLRSGPPSNGAVISSILPPEGTRFVPAGDLGGPVEVSPDGTTLAFVAAGADGQRRLWVRPLDRPDARALAGTAGATFPFWSADSRSLGFFARERLHTVSAAGGPPVSVCAARGGRGGTWNRDGVILLAPDFRTGIYRVPATGGSPEPVTFLDQEKHTTHRWPMFCPDGDHFLYLAVVHGVAEIEDNGVYLASLSGGEPQLVLRGSANAVATATHLLYARNNALMASAFDLSTGRITGEPAMITTKLSYDPSIWRAAFSLSQTGVLAFQSGDPGGIQVNRVDRSGKPLGAIGKPEYFSAARLSPDATRVAASISGAETEIWVYDLGRGTRTRITFNEGSDVSPVWSPDGRDLAFASMRLSLPDEPRRILRIPASGGSEQVLFAAEDDIWPTSWSSDGKFLLFNRGRYVSPDLGDVWALPLDGNSQPFPVATESFPEGEAKFSPDGKWIALNSAPSGTSEIFILPFDPPADPAAPAPPQRGGRWQVSVNGGQEPEWRGDGKELFYVAPDGSIMAVEIAASDGSLSIGAPTRLVASASAMVNISVDPLDAAPDGDWFLVATSTTQGATPITLVTNWPAAMKMP